jgi:hypothetical protein
MAGVQITQERLSAAIAGDRYNLKRDVVNISSSLFI